LEFILKHGRLIQRHLPANGGIPSVIESLIGGSNPWLLALFRLSNRNLTLISIIFRAEIEASKLAPIIRKLDIKKSSNIANTSIKNWKQMTENWQLIDLLVEIRH